MSDYIFIPCSVVKPILERELAKRGYPDVTWRLKGIERFSPQDQVVFQTGLSKKTLEKIRLYPEEQVALDSVDKLLSGLDLTHLWFEEPLNGYYNMLHSDE